jgi:TonB family protein
MYDTSKSTGFSLSDIFVPSFCGEAMTEDWTKWEGLIIDRVFPLRRFLGKSSHSVVFLTEHTAHDLPDAAIKLIPVDPTMEEAQLSRWRIAAALSHPHLIRIFDSGRCRLGGHPFLFVVMEYAEQTLGQILPHRALTSDEVREMLLPTLDALAFLHGKNLAHGQLKPPNVLVVDDRVKLSSDNVRPAGDSSVATAEPSLYDSPEAKDGRISAAGDTWALGVTIVEALTQSPPAWPDERREIVSWPASLPSAYVSIVRRCLSRYPAGRPTITDLKALIKRVAQAPEPKIEVTKPAVTEAAAEATATKVAVTEVAAIEPPGTEAAATEAAAAETPVTEAAVAAVSGPTTAAVTEGAVAAVTEAAASQAAVSTAAVSNPAVSNPAVSNAAVSNAAVSNAAVSNAAVNEPPRQSAAAEPPVARRLSGAAIAAAALAVLAVIWIGWRLFHGHPNNLQQPASSNSQPSSPQAALRAAPAQNLPASAPAPASTPAPALESAAVVHQVIPDVPRHARESIRGRIKITVRVTVDRSGNVVGERLVNSGSSKYFARLATDAAAKWKFVPADKQGSREGLLRFEFTRGGATGQLAAPPT